MTHESSTIVVAPWSRVAILLTALTAGCGLSYYLTGSLVPTLPGDALVFQSTLLFVILGSSVLEHKFTRPADSVVNALMGMVSLVTVYGVAPRGPWLGVLGYCAVVFVLSLSCTVVSTGPNISGWRATVSRLTYRPAVVFGRARVLYSVVFLFAILSFYGLQSPRTGALVLFWGLFLALWPLRVPELLSAWSRKEKGPEPVGRVTRLDSPNLLRIELDPSRRWDESASFIYQAPDGQQHRVLPLYVNMREGHTVATGLCAMPSTGHVANLVHGCVYDAPDGQSILAADVSRELGGGENSDLVGFVIEDSTIGAIRFETWRPERCREGLLVWCMIGNKQVYYQVTEGLTREETLQTDRHGFQFAVASQLGVLVPEAGFERYAWLPTMNAPVFCEAENAQASGSAKKEGDFVYGRVPGTKIEVGGPFFEALDHHTAILGVTGSGKTELAFDLIRHTIARGGKVICIDLTARYEDRLKDLNGENLSISGELADELGKKLFDVETGQYGAGKEKQALKEFAERLREDVGKRLPAFLESAEAGDKLGLITLNEISNTKATIFITELYLSCLLHFAKDSPNKCPRTLVVVEEAHTVMPEASTMGLGDYDSRGMVSKIAQIALQGRKYGIGLLVVTQRTATVSKTVLTQCNTMITLNCFDQTSLGFLENVYGRTHTQLIASLPKLHAVVFGKGVRSERPIVVEIPFDAAKKGA